MAQRFISGLYCPYADGTNGGRFVSKALIEWLTQVVGWSVVDFVGAKWALVAASGSGTASATAFDTIDITSPSYTFTSANAGWYLTITGYTGGDEGRNGIYRIRKLLNTVGSVYTLQIYPIYGVHHTGFAVASGLNWRLWAGNDTYCPTSTAEIAVLGGTGNTGAGLSDGTRTSVSLDISQGGSTSTLTDAGATFLASDVGKQITITGSAVPGNNNTFTIATRISNTQITYTNASGGNDTFTGSWKITYIFHMYYKCNGTSYGYGSISVSPFASWNNVSHSWSDGRYTSEIGVWTDGRAYPVIWAEADTDHFTVFVSSVGSDMRYKRLTCHAVGELDAFYPESDPHPIWAWGGGDSAAYAETVYHSDTYPIIGYESARASYSYYNSFRALGHDDLTTLTCYASFVHCLSSADFHAMTRQYRMLSRYSNRLYRVPIVLESRTSGFMEFRGTIRNIWACSPCLPLIVEQGASGEFLHIARGMMVPWNGSRLAWAFTGFQSVG